MRPLPSVLVVVLLAGCLGGDASSVQPEPEAVAALPPTDEASTPTEAPPAAGPSPSSTPAPKPAAPPPATEPTVAADAEPAPVADRVRIAVLDTGILPTHEAFLPGQVVAWYDFTRTDRPDHPKESWDPTVEPYDDHGHGTGTASMAAGVGSHEASHGAGIDLVIGKIADRDNTALWANLAEGIEWAHTVAKADVISMSFYSYIPTPPGVASNAHVAAMDAARQAGVLPVVLAGNGLGNFGLPTLSWMHSPAHSQASLIVGGASSSGSPVAPMGSMDPEVTALYAVKAACPEEPDCYVSTQGTSFSTPLVAGMAARLLLAARDAGLDPTADDLELILKHCARDTSSPPALEGYGFLGDEGLACGLEAVLAGTTGPAPDPVTEAWVETVQASERQVWGG